MKVERKPFFDFLMLAILVAGLALIVGMTVIINHTDTETIIRDATADLKADIAELRAELKAHDAAPEWWEGEK